ncbi:inositol 2-dehydrogenase [Actinoplanes italicus]|uniref:Inositol 2-dehydrogenase n=1 Tax=Actinoplanes italicus TaxID=113567 RepID=A0A2T0K1G7_9ACTN|nr:Gfo/Idh/MocA family oxidoreductase [Actinoplanes italicus]PRX16638.1 myo-inositol 2-dehydrogenase/D-chiro-inositol 1-dehydrogenase [Actinoplanes italicus]GIE33846.1 inositol 2-dehydrogenase [Actinoplanes italicus]
MRFLAEVAQAGAATGRHVVKRIGIIGTGIMGADHARLLTDAVSGACVGGVFDPDAERAGGVAARSGGARVFADPYALIGDDGIDAVLIASSDATHEEYVLACVAAGKPVLCEKPLAPTTEGCARILEAEAAHGSRLVTVGFMRRFDPGYTDLKAVLDGGEVGIPLMIHHVHRNPAAVPGIPGSALITNSAVHELDITRWLFGEEITEVAVHTPRPSGRAGGTRDPQLLILTTESGVLADVEIFVNARYGYEVRCELVAEEGTVTLDAPPPTSLRRGGLHARELPADWRPRFAEAYRLELQDWIDGTGRGATAWDGFAATYVAQACVAALESGERHVVGMPSIPRLYRG